MKQRDGGNISSITSAEFSGNDKLAATWQKSWVFFSLKLKICFLNTTYHIMLTVTMTMNSSKGEIDVLFPDTLAILIHSLAFARSFFSSG